MEKHEREYNPWDVILVDKMLLWFAIQAVVVVENISDHPSQN